MSSLRASAARQQNETKNNNNSISYKRVIIVISENSDFLHLLIVSNYHPDLRASRHPLR